MTKRILLGFIFLLITACASNKPLTNTRNGEQKSPRQSQGFASHLLKTDFNRMADLELEENMQSLSVLMLKLYKRNPNQLAKSTSDSAQRMVDWVFEGADKHHWQFQEINNKQGTDAIRLAFERHYTGDRVLPFIVGIATMYQTVHGGKKSFFLTDAIDPQSAYNAARNVELAVWKLSTEKDANGALYLISNTANSAEQNLSFEREFGKMIGRTDLFALMLAEKSQRTISKIAQSVASTVFLPF